MNRLLITKLHNGEIHIQNVETGLACVVPSQNFEASGPGGRQYDEFILLAPVGDKIVVEGWLESFAPDGLHCECEQPEATITIEGNWTNG